MLIKLPAQLICFLLNLISHKNCSSSHLLVPCGSGAFSLEEGRIAPLPLPRHVVRGDYLECLAM